MNNQMNNDMQIGLNQTGSQINNQTMPGKANNMSVQSGASAKMVAGSRKKVLPKGVQNNPKYTENWINVKAISNNIIYNNNGEMITGVKIQPKNIFILDYSQMDNTLIGLMNFYNTIDYEFWLMVADRPVDIAMYQAELQLLFNKTQDQRIRKIISQDMAKGDLFTNNNVVDTEYFLLFKEKNMDALQKKVRNLINGLASCGMTASQTSNDDLRMIIDNFLNGGRTFNAGGVMPL